MPKENQGCLSFLLKLFGFDLDRATISVAAEEPLPYRLRDNFLSPAELSFFQVLQESTAEHFHVCCKVRISDLIYVVNRRNNVGFANRIDRKHVDFVLSTPKTMVPLLVVELDDSSHQRQDRKDRDDLVNRAFGAAGLPILHVVAKRGYSVGELRQQIRNALFVEGPVINAKLIDANEPPAFEVVAKGQPKTIPNCPKCNIPMVERCASKGVHKGKQFWACPSYPECRKIISFD